MKDCNDGGACMGRREFLVKAGLVAGGAVLTVSSLGNKISAATFEDVTVAIGADSPLAKVGGSQVVDSSAGKIIVIRAEQSKFVAFSAKCTHKGSLLNYNAETKGLECPKHGSKFDGTKGTVTNGPADTPLAAYVAKGSDTAVTVVVTP